MSTSPAVTRLHIVTHARCHQKDVNQTYPQTDDPSTQLLPHTRKLRKSGFDYKPLQPPATKTETPKRHHSGKVATDFSRKFLEDVKGIFPALWYNIINRDTHAPNHESAKRYCPRQED